jgi:energy-coupling factor transporter ATP-binding protein EcfA2
MSLLQSLQHIMIYPESHEQYHAAYQSLLNATVTEEQEGSVINFLELLNQPVCESTFTFTAEALKEIPKLFSVPADSNQFQWCCAAFNCLRNNLLDYDSCCLYLSTQLKNHDHDIRKFFMASLVLQAFMGYQQNNGLSLKHQYYITHFLSSKEATLKNDTPNEITEALTILKHFFYHTGHPLQKEIHALLASSEIILPNLAFMLNSMKQAIEQTQLDDAVLVIGSAGSGKSTLLNALAGIPLKERNDTLVVDPDHMNKPHARIGSGSSSITLYPEILSTGKIALVELPDYGLAFDGEHKKELVAALAYPLILQQAKKIRAVIITIENAHFNSVRNLSHIEDRLERLGNMLPFHDDTPVFVALKQPDISYLPNSKKERVKKNVMECIDYVCKSLQESHEKHSKEYADINQQLQQTTFSAVRKFELDQRNMASNDYQSECETPAEFDYLTNRQTAVKIAGLKNTIKVLTYLTNHPERIFLFSPGNTFDETDALLAALHTEQKSIPKENICVNHIIDEATNKIDSKSKELFDRYIKQIQTSAATSPHAQYSMFHVSNDSNNNTDRNEEKTQLTT